MRVLILSTLAVTLLAGCVTASSFPEVDVAKAAGELVGQVESEIYTEEVVLRRVSIGTRGCTNGLDVDIDGAYYLYAEFVIEADFDVTAQKEFMKSIHAHFVESGYDIQSDDIDYIWASDPHGSLYRIFPRDDPRFIKFSVTSTCYADDDYDSVDISDMDFGGPSDPELDHAGNDG